MQVGGKSALFKYQQAYSDGRYIHSNTRVTRQAAKDLIRSLTRREETKTNDRDRERYTKKHRNQMVSYRDSRRKTKTERGKTKGNVGNPPLSRISSNPDTNPVS